MASFQSFPSSESTTSLTVLGSSSVIDKENFEQKVDGLDLYGCLCSGIDLLTVGVCGSLSSDSCSIAESNYSSFSSNSIFSGSFGRNSCLITTFTSLNTTYWLYTTFLFSGLQNLYPSLYPIKMHLSDLLSNLVLFSFGTCTYASHPNTLRCEREGFLLFHASYGYLPSNADEGDLLAR